MITGTQALRTIEEVVQEFGADYIYQGEPGERVSWNGTPLCMYLFKDDTPGCLIGHVLVRLGVDKALIRKFNESGISEATEYGVKMNSKALRIMEAAQTHQDQRGTWGGALQAARKAARS